MSTSTDTGHRVASHDGAHSVKSYKHIYMKTHTHVNEHRKFTCLGKAESIDERRIRAS